MARKKNDPNRVVASEVTRKGKPMTAGSRRVYKTASGYSATRLGHVGKTSGGSFYYAPSIANSTGKRFSSEGRMIASAKKRGEYKEFKTAKAADAYARGKSDKDALIVERKFKRRAGDKPKPAGRVQRRTRGR